MSRARLEFQGDRVNSEAMALFAIVGPILKALLYSARRDRVDRLGGYDQLTFDSLSMIYKEGDGDVGICFEYAVHDAILRGNPHVLERVDHALSLCRISGSEPSSLLFGAEKAGAVDLVDSISKQLTDESELLYGSKGRPVKLKKSITAVANAFRDHEIRGQLPHSIRDAWKADLFIGRPSVDQWVGTTIKINKHDLEGGRGLRIGIIPMSSGTSDRVYVDQRENLVVCPLPYDHSFVDIFYRSFILVRAALMRCPEMPPPVFVPDPDDRFVCSELLKRRNYPVLDIVDALSSLSQRGLLASSVEDRDAFKTADLPTLNLKDGPRIDTTIMPMPIVE